MLRVGAVGCGPIGLIHQQAVKSHAKAKLVGVCDLVFEKARARGEALGVPAFPNLKAMLAAVEMDAADVVTQDTHHHDPVMEALAAGKHVLVEKPLAIELREAEAMVAEAARRRLHLAINHNRRFGFAYRTGKRWLDEGRIGKLGFVLLRQAQGGPYGTRKPYHLVWDMGSHMFDLIRFFGGDVLSLKAEMTDTRSTGYYTSIAVSMKLSSGAVSTLLFSWDSVFTKGLELLELCGDKARATIHEVNREAYLYPHEGEENVAWQCDPFHGYTFADTFTRRVHGFIDDLEAGRPPAPLGSDGLASLHLMYDCIRSFEEDRVVKPEVRA